VILGAVGQIETRSVDRRQHRFMQHRLRRAQRLQPLLDAVDGAADAPEIEGDQAPDVALAEGLVGQVLDA
jgi:hypothetical protein